MSKSGGTPILVKNLGSVTLGPDIRRGIAELDGKGEVVGGIVIMRYGENALKVIERLRTKLEEIKPTLLRVEIVTTYDRGDLIERAIDTLKSTLTEELIIVSIVILIFLWHIPSALVPIITIPITIILSFIPMRLMGLTANIMSLGGLPLPLVPWWMQPLWWSNRRIKNWSNGRRRQTWQLQRCGD